jgi:hypothetical protein
MKKWFFLFLLPVLCYGQDQNSVQSEVRQGSLVLLSWSVANMAGAGIGASQSDGSNLYFHQMNGYWNVINASIATASLLPSNKRTKPFSQIELAARYRKIYLINAGLDIGYMVAGGVMQHRAQGANTDRLAGFGNGMILQGGFLFVYDLWMAQRMRKWTNNSSGRLKVSPTVYGLNLSFGF